MSNTLPISAYSRQETVYIELAIRFAMDAHGGKTDRYGNPAVLHALKVGLGTPSAVEMAAGFLHDTVETGALTLDDLRKAGFPDEVVSIVDGLTRRAGEDWETYICRVMESPAAMRVKLRDLEHNLDARRMRSFGPDDAERFERYLQAWIRIRTALEEFH
ncbi:MAG: GTP pyrophosphokinase [Bacteroidota bacterium]|nr:GTP pyrophosphokinase [Bacteroidota bacterium]